MQDSSMNDDVDVNPTNVDEVSLNRVHWERYWVFLGLRFMGMISPDDQMVCWGCPTTYVLNQYIFSGYPLWRWPMLLFRIRTLRRWLYSWTATRCRDRWTTCKNLAILKSAIYSKVVFSTFEPHISTGLTLWYRELIALSQVEIHVSKPAHVE